MSWYKEMQEVTNDLRKTARIILMQRRGSLEWAQKRLWEFAEILARRPYCLVPDRNRNGIDWTQRLKKSEDDLVFFDHYYGAFGDYYARTPVSLRLGIQCLEGERPITFFEAFLQIDLFAGEEEDVQLCCGSVRLTGIFGSGWSVDIWFPVMRNQDKAVIASLFGAFVPEWFFEEGGGRFRATVAPKAARSLFTKMAQYFIATRG